LELDLIDDVVKEPLGGAHHEPEAAAKGLKASILQFFKSVDGVDMRALLAKRYERFRRIGAFTTSVPPTAPPAASKSPS
jgi:acetyl-CoA carboxylase carboxyl transferase subunit alpha